MASRDVSADKCGRAGPGSHKIRTEKRRSKRSNRPEIYTGDRDRRDKRRTGIMSLDHALLLLLFVPVILCEPLVYKDCGCDRGKLISVDVSPCPKQPCPLVRGSTYTINVTFTSGEATPSCSAVVYGEIAKIPVPFPLPESDGCKSGISCPLVGGTTYTYLTKMYIKPQYPAMKLVVKWELRDADNNNLFCWEIPVQIVDG